MNESDWLKPLLSDARADDDAGAFVGRFRRRRRKLQGWELVRDALWRAALVCLVGLAGAAGVMALTHLTRLAVEAAL